jgi:hypothetical protein
MISILPFLCIFIHFKCIIIFFLYSLVFFSSKAMVADVGVLYGTLCLLVKCFIIFVKDVFVTKNPVEFLPI